MKVHKITLDRREVMGAGSLFETPVTIYRIECQKAVFKTSAHWSKVTCKRCLARRKK